ncbi:hypothetical protein COLO4_36751 [Corchorus olitorius]|uniref:Uncharacterized protein n=1 Tax=Corchorus olitorius TaxID=93759 RepID=A0A1R3G5U8_9ROSI|nr:hypothetical protein COLO4_36751 [Corchorus olitorius]
MNPNQVSPPPSCHRTGAPMKLKICRKLHLAAPVLALTLNSPKSSSSFSNLT